MFAALVKLSARFPSRVKGSDSENGSEFINNHLLRYCRDEDQGVSDGLCKPYREER